MKKVIFAVAAAMIMTGCGMMKRTTVSVDQPANNTTSTTATTAAPATAASAGQGAGTALLNLYSQYKADGNKYDYKNMQNILNTVSLIANCEGLKSNYKDKTYLKDFGKGIENIEEARKPLFTTGGSERSGMGFTIMESFMDKLRVRSAPGKGTTVVMQRAIRLRVGKR